METQVQHLKASPRDFFLHLGTVAALYTGAVSILGLLFEIINYAFPDALDSYVDPYSSAVRTAMATVMIALPAFLFLLGRLRKDYKTYPEKEGLWIKRWLSYLTLFLAGVTIAITLITLINAFLGGEISIRFSLKVLSVLAVAGAIFGYHLAELRKGTGGTKGIARAFAIGTSLFVIASLVAGFAVMGSPFTQRLKRLDAQRINDLQNVQWQIIYRWQQKGELPKELPELNDPISGYSVPNDPEYSKGKFYSYKPTGNLSFQLCGTFGTEGSEKDTYSYPSREYYFPMPNITSEGMPDPKNQNWKHGIGESCFDRTIDPKLYPPRKEDPINKI